MTSAPSPTLPSLGMSLLSEWLELSHEAGALFAGLVLMDTPHVQRAAQAVEPLTALFGGMYLASLGMIMSPTFLLAHLGIIVVYVAVVYLLKVGVVSLVMRSFGFALPASLAAGVIMAQGMLGWLAARRKPRQSHARAPQTPLLPPRRPHPPPPISLRGLAVLCGARPGARSREPAW